jgi:hypothetical protein
MRQRPPGRHTDAAGTLSTTVGEAAAQQQPTSNRGLRAVRTRSTSSRPNGCWRRTRAGPPVEERDRPRPRQRHDLGFSPAPERPAIDGLSARRASAHPANGVARFATDEAPPCERLPRQHGGRVCASTGAPPLAWRWPSSARSSCPAQVDARRSAVERAERTPPPRLRVGTGVVSSYHGSRRGKGRAHAATTAARPEPAGCGNQALAPVSGQRRDPVNDRERRDRTPSPR